MGAPARSGSWLYFARCRHILRAFARAMSSLRQRSFLNASVAAGSVLALGLLLLARTAGAATFCINYSASPDVAALRDYDFSILSPEARVEAAELRRLGHRSHAYLSVVEVAKDAPYRAEVLARQIPLLGKNEVWLGDLADVAQPAWTDFVVNTLAVRAAQKGYGGFFLDTADSVELLEKQFPQRGAAFREGLYADLRDRLWGPLFYHVQGGADYAFERHSMEYSGRVGLSFQPRKSLEFGTELAYTTSSATADGGSGVWEAGLSVRWWF